MDDYERNQQALHNERMRDRAELRRLRAAMSEPAYPPIHQPVLGWLGDDWEIVRWTGACWTDGDYDDLPIERWLPLPDPAAGTPVPEGAALREADRPRRAKIDERAASLSDIMQVKEGLKVVRDHD
jgi:hypothetical protein